MESQEGYVRYKQKNETRWTARISEVLLTREEIQKMRFQGYEFEKDYSLIPDLVIPEPPKELEYKKIKKSEMREDCVYVLCPDKKCGMFWHKDFFACEGHCPKEDKQDLLVICKDCDNILHLGSNHSSFQRLDHKCRGIGCKFRLRSSSNFKLIYDVPE
jgi:hypothetical protein